MILFLFICLVWWLCGAQIWLSTRPGLRNWTQEEQMDYVRERPGLFILCYLPMAVVMFAFCLVTMIYLKFKYK